MIEKQFVKQKLNEFQIQTFLKKELTNCGIGKIEIKRTPLGEKIVVYTSRPGLVVGKKGETIKRLTIVLKKKFRMENPQLEVGEIENPSLDPSAVAERIVYALERFGSKRFKSIGYQSLQEIIDAGGLGAEIVISGKVPSSRAKSWRFKAGHLKKSGDIALSKIKRKSMQALLKSGVIGVKVSIMTPDIMMPDKFEVKEETKKQIEEKKEEKIEVKKRVRKKKDEIPSNEIPEVKEEVKAEEKDGNNKKE